MTTSRCLALLAAVTMLFSLSAGIAFGHVERSSYWPDPAPDKSVEPAAGGKVPKARSLASALRSKSRGDTYVVCKSDSLGRAKRSIARAQTSGWSPRPTVTPKKLSKKAAKQLLKINKQLAKRCDFRHIQAAVNETTNNDRVVVMPGEYLEEPSRKEPTNDPTCKRFEERSERGAGAATYRYQVNCPNDQNLIYIQGRALTKKKVPFPPRADRRGLPDEGRCLRCNLQIEGSGVSADDVVIDLAKNAKVTKLRGPAAPIKDVGVRADRADGFVIRNVTVAHAAEHGIYVHEADGYLLSKFKVFYNKEYGTLAFTSDHGLTADCEGMGHGDAAVYPGGSPDTGEQTVESARRANQEITRCDIHHNTLGYSGTMGNATHVHHNNFWDNSTAITTDSFFAGGHPGYPQDSALFEKNRIYSNNFNSYEAASDVEPRVPVPIGVGILIGGGNGNEIRNNRIWDNWRRGTMLLHVPDSLSNQPNTTNSVSHRNRQHDNLMGVAQNGDLLPNGVDFWWDEAPAQEDNCWYDNGSAATDPPAPVMPSSCDNTSDGAGYSAKLTGELAPCAGAIGGSGSYDPATCSWFRAPAKPAAVTARGARSVPFTDPVSGMTLADLVTDACTLTGSALSCSPFRDRP